jgi:GNAT superfamily N-acetyltransferase
VAASQGQSIVSDLRIVTSAERRDLLDQYEGEIVAAAWPEFMLNDHVANRLFGKLYDVFPEYQFMLVDDQDYVLAVGNSIPLHWEQHFDQLPDLGWDWALEQGFVDHEAGRAPNIQSALSIAIRPNLQGKGLSRRMVEAMREIGAAHGLADLIAPVRPSMKSRYPLTAIERYIMWQNEDGTPFDAWMRVHVRVGATIVKAATQSMLIKGSITEWEGWTGMRFPESGRYVVQGALSPIEIDCDQDEGRYVEPNVWMRHKIRQG